MAEARPFLMFEGRAREAMAFYTATLPGGAVVDETLYGPEGPGPEGSVMVATISVAGLEIRVSDSFISHGFTFTPSISIFLDLGPEEDAEFERIVADLAEGGETMMPPDDYGFSRRFAWVQDRFGVSWQVNLT